MNEKKDGPQAKRKKKEGRVTTRPHSCGRGRREKKRRNHKKIRSPPPHQFQKKTINLYVFVFAFFFDLRWKIIFTQPPSAILFAFFFLSAFDQIRQSSSRWMAIKEKRDTEDTITSTSPLKTKNNRLFSRFFFYRVSLRFQSFFRLFGDFNASHRNQPESNITTVPNSINRTVKFKKKTIATSSLRRRSTKIEKKFHLTRLNHQKTKQTGKTPPLGH